MKYTWDVTWIYMDLMRYDYDRFPSFFQNQSTISVCVSTASGWKMLLLWGLQSDSSRCRGKSGQRNSGKHGWEAGKLSGHLDGTFIELNGGLPARTMFDCQRVSFCLFHGSYQSEYILLRPKLVTIFVVLCFCFFLGNYPKMALIHVISGDCHPDLFLDDPDLSNCWDFSGSRTAARAGREWEDQWWKAGRADLSGNGWRLARYIYRYLGHLVVVKMKGLDCSHIID